MVGFHVKFCLILYFGLHSYLTSLLTSQKACYLVLTSIFLIEGTSIVAYYEWRVYIYIPLALPPHVVQGLLIIRASRSHTHTHIRGSTPPEE
jgi:hypothetical protein